MNTNRRKHIDNHDCNQSFQSIELSPASGISSPILSPPTKSPVFSPIRVIDDEKINKENVTFKYNCPYLKIGSI